MSRLRLPTAAALAAAALLAAPGCSTTLYEKGAVRRVETGKTASAPALSASALWEGGALRLRLAERSDVRLRRRVVYNTILWEGGYNPILEPVELATAGLYLPIMAVLAATGLAPPDAPGVEVPASTRWIIGTAPLNPAASFMAVDIRRVENADMEVFSDPPLELAYAMTLPVRRRAVGYRVLDARGRTLAEGRGETDIFGELVVLGLASRPAHVRVECGGFAETVRIE